MCATHICINVEQRNPFVDFQYVPELMKIFQARHSAAKRKNDRNENGCFFLQIFLELKGGK